jgi:hypothetical protein
MLPEALGSEVYSASNINENQKNKTFLWSRVRPVRKASKPYAISQPIVSALWDHQHLTNLTGLHSLLPGSFIFTVVLPVQLLPGRKINVLMLCIGSLETLVSLQTLPDKKLTCRSGKQNNNDECRLLGYKNPLRTS